MTAVQSFEISLEHDIDEQYQYEPGETLRGAVLVELRNNVKIEGINLQIRGEGTIGWSEDHIRHGCAIRADETYIDSTQALVASYGETKVFPKGHHKFPFEMELPPNIPSSFIGKFGSITYVLKATLKECKRHGMESTTRGISTPLPKLTNAPTDYWKITT